MKTNLVLSERLLKIADMVIPGETCADIGTDHGYLPAYLLRNGICDRVILSDLNPGPLNNAKNNFMQMGISGGDFRLGSGISVLENAEASTVIIAGMGGELIESILISDLDKSQSFKKLILQPRTRSDELRVSLKRSGFEICDYALAKERGRLCEIYAVRKSEDPAEEDYLISGFLLENRDPLLYEFIDFKINQKSNMISSLKNSSTDKSDVIAELSADIEKLRYYRSKYC